MIQVIRSMPLLPANSTTEELRSAASVMNAFAPVGMEFDVSGIFDRVLTSRAFDLGWEAQCARPEIRAIRLSIPMQEPMMSPERLLQIATNCDATDLVIRADPRALHALRREDDFWAEFLVFLRNAAFAAMRADVRIHLEGSNPTVIRNAVDSINSPMVLGVAHVRWKGTDTFQPDAYPSVKKNTNKLEYSESESASGLESEGNRNRLDEKYAAVVTDPDALFDVTEVQELAFRSSYVRLEPSLGQSISDDLASQLCRRLVAIGFQGRLVLPMR